MTLPCFITGYRMIYLRENTAYQKGGPVARQEKKQSKMTQKLIGLIAAVHTPMSEDGSVRLDQIRDLAAHLKDSGVQGVFVAGTTGECLSLTVQERLDLTRRWVEEGVRVGLKVIIHVGHNCLPSAQRLAAHAEQNKADAIAAMAPNYFKPDSVPLLLDFCEAVACQAPTLPFYYYDIPLLTGVSLPMELFLQQGKARIPTLTGIKYTNPDLIQFQRCLHLEDGAFDILFGCDEALLAGLVLGAQGAVGSTYNFAAPLYSRIIRAFQAGDLKTARAEQHRSVLLVDLLYRHGFSGSAKAIMSMIGLDLGPVRLPLKNLDEPKKEALRKELESIGFFDWRR
jgi:N-acetylneuraminate lyase